MMLSSSSSRKKISLINKSLKSKSSKKCSKKNSKNKEKPQIYISQFKVNNFRKNKNKDSNQNSNPINNKIKIGPSANNIISSNTENPLNNLDQNSTFVFTGDNASCLDNNQIIENYLKKPLIDPTFECRSISTISIKEENGFNYPNDNSFTLSSSKTSIQTKAKSTKINNLSNEKLMQILKQININDSYSPGINNQEKEKKERNIPKNKGNSKAQKNVDKRKKEKKIVKEKKVKKKTKKLFFVLFVFLNVFVYAFLIIKLFEPSVSRLFYDNDHDNYVYSTSLLSQDRSIVMNK